MYQQELVRDPPGLGPEDRIPVVCLSWFHRLPGGTGVTYWD